MTNFKRNLEKIMRERGLTQTDIANYAHAKQNSVSRWLNTDSMPNMKYLEPLAEALGLNVSELLGDYSGGITLSEEDKELFDLPKSQKQMLLKIHSIFKDEMKKNKSDKD